MLNFLISTSMIFAVVYTLTAFISFAQIEICNRHKKTRFDTDDYGLTDCPGGRH